MLKEEEVSEKQKKQFRFYNNPEYKQKPIEIAICQ